MIHLLHHLRGRSVHELRTRAAQAIAAAAERHGLSARARLPDDHAFFGSLLKASRASGARDAQALLAHFRARSTPRFFAGFADRATTLDVLRARWPAEEQRVIETAERICAGHFDLLGRHGLSFGEPIDWHLDPLAGHRAPLAHWSRVPYLDAERVGDHKLIWELNRHQYFVTLGQAYWYTNDECYAECFVHHLTSWMEANPPKLGINWASSLEVAFRAIAWTWALYLFRDSPRLTSALFARALKFLWLHGRHIETYLSTYFSPNTHLTGEALGLFYLGTLFPELRQARRWRQMGQRILVEQLDVHVLPDGVYCEQATYYHHYTADFYLHLLTLAQANGARLPSVVERKLHLLLEHLMQLTRPDGTTPLFGDDDGGHLVPLGGRAAADFRPIIATGAVLLGHSEYRFVAGAAAEHTLWLLGPEGIRAWDALAPERPRRDSAAFPDGGYYVMRDGWDTGANQLVIGCGRHGFLNGGHAHADALALTLVADGRTVLVDPGTYTYTAEPERRTHFRSSLAHNTVTVDGESQSVPGTAFQWEYVAHAEPREWISHDRFDFFAGEHDGYRRLADPAMHRRAILFLKRDYWIVCDRVDAAGEHEMEARYHFASGTGLEPNRDDAVGVRSETGEELLRMVALGHHGAPRRGEGWMSPGYGRLERAPWCALRRRGVGAQALLSLLLPPSAGVREARAVPCTGGRALALASPAWADRLLLSGRPDGGMAAAGVAARAEWAWVRTLNDTGRVSECVLLGGARIEIDGELTFEAEMPVRFAYLRCEGDVLHVEIEPAVGFSARAPGLRLAVVNNVPHVLGVAGHLAIAGSRAGRRAPSDEPALVS
jgi:hypothetical protein